MPPSSPSSSSFSSSFRMPGSTKTPASSLTQVTTRRSSRLNKRQAAPDPIEPQEIPKSKRRRVTLAQASLAEGSSNCFDDAISASGRVKSANLRRSQRITPSELLQREKSLLHKEQEHKRRVDELNERILALSKKEDEASLIMCQMAEREAKATLGQLEEHFTCPLCYEIMAHPYTLNPGQCGHTFCAICILKWFFSRLHRACGGWHESVDCPICRSLLVITPERVPRLEITFPFVPNRTASAVCSSLIEKLAQSPPGSTVVKREASEGIWASGSGSGWSSDCVKKREKDEPEDENAGVVEWREGGALRAEWLKKEREGKKEMSHLLKYWALMESPEFIAMKSKLGV